MRLCTFQRLAGVMLLALLGISSAARSQGVPAALPHVAEIQRCERLSQLRPEEAIAAAEGVLGQPRLEAAPRLMATACMGIAQFVLGRGEDGAATTDVVMALLESDALSINERQRGRFPAAMLLIRSGRGAQAMGILEDMQAQALQDGDIRLQIASLSTIAQLRVTDFDDPEGALGYYRQAYRLASAPGQPMIPQRVVLGYELGYTLLLLGQIDEAAALFQEADVAAAKFPELALIQIRIASHRAEILRLKGELPKAQTQLQDVLVRLRELGDAAGEVVALQRLARVSLGLERMGAARESAEQALRLAEAGKMPMEQRDSLYLLADIASASGEAQIAADYAGRARALDRAEGREKTAQKLARLQATAARELQPEQVLARQDASRARLLRDLGLAALAIIALVSLVLLVRTRRQKHRLAELSTTDPLTGLMNRRAADGALQALTADGRRAALLLLDVDAFKSINDRFGHDIGDAALSQIARCLREACDVGDVVARWGGEEFLVARGDTSRMAAFALAEHLRRQVERLRVDDGRGGTLPLTVSTGVSSLPVFPSDTPRWQDAIRVADRALYVAKRAGRNAWAGVWGLEAGDGVDVYSVLDNPGHALQQGWIEIGGNRPMDWSQVRPKAAGGTRGGGGPVRQETASRP